MVAFLFTVNGPVNSIAVMSSHFSREREKKQLNPAPGASRAGHFPTITQSSRTTGAESYLSESSLMLTFPVDQTRRIFGDN